MMKNFFLGVFVLAAVVQLVASLLEWGVADNISKCLLLPALFGYYFSTAARSVMFGAALFFCWVGDILLIFPQETFFMGGLAAFLTGHVLYTIAYRQFRSEDAVRELLVTQKIRFSLPIILAGTGLYVVLLPQLGGLMTPVLIYTVVIVLMTMTALFRYGRTSSSSFWLVFGGAILFMTSDSILALNKFLSPVPMAGFWIMVTYITAQFLIVEGIRRHV